MPFFLLGCACNGDCHRARRVNTVIEETMGFLAVNPFGCDEGNTEENASPDSLRAHGWHTVFQPLRPRFEGGNYGLLGNFEFGTIFNINLGAPRARPSSFLLFFLLAKCRRRPGAWRACTWREERKEERKNMILARKCCILGQGETLAIFSFGVCL